MNKIDNGTIKKYSKKFNSNKSNIISRNALTSTSLQHISINRDIVQSVNPTFYKKIEVDTKITNQASSGRCWIFSFINVIRLHMIKKYDLDEDFEFSQNYLLFWDQLEKANMFLDNIFNSLQCNINTRLLHILLQNPTQDGGQWNMLVNLVNKYGLIPKDLMEETHQSSNTQQMNDLINAKLIHFAHTIRNLTPIQLKNKKKIVEDMIYQIYTILVMFLGEPPKSFIWKYYSSSSKKPNSTKKQRKIPRITPLDFYKKYVPYNANNKVVLINAPLKTKPYYNIYNIEYFNNMVNGVETKYVNVPIEIMIEATKKSIDNNEAVWFGCNVGKYSNDVYGLLNDKVYDYKSIFGFDIELNKGDGLEYFQSILNHAMTIRGYDIDNNKNITQWLVENSWGDEIGKDGEYIMSNDWYKKFVYQIVIDKKFLDTKTLKSLTKTPIMCPLWDPFGSLAIT